MRTLTVFEGGGEWHIEKVALFDVCSADTNAFTAGFELVMLVWSRYAVSVSPWSKVMSALDVETAVVRRDAAVSAPPNVPVPPNVPAPPNPAFP